MRNKLVFTAVAMALGFAFVQAWPGDWGGLGNAYAQAQVAVKKIHLAQEYPDFSGDSLFMRSILTVHGDNGRLVIRRGDPGKIKYRVSYNRDSNGWRLLGFAFGNKKSLLEKEKAGNSAKFDVDKGELEIHTGSHWNYLANVWVPKNVRIKITNNNGVVRVIRHQGSVAVSANNGNITIDASEGPIKIRANNGRVMVIGGLEGTDVEIHNGEVSVKGSGPKNIIKIGNGNAIFIPMPTLQMPPCIKAHVVNGSVQVSPPWSVCHESKTDLEVHDGKIFVGVVPMVPLPPNSIETRIQTSSSSH